MKQFFNIMFWSLASVALGLGIGLYLGTQVSVADRRTIIAIISFVAAAVFYLAGIIMTTAIGRNTKRRKNLTVSLQNKDFILQAGATYHVQKRGKLRPGEYTVLATDESQKTFNLRVNDYVKEYTHNTTLVLTEGDTVSARSSNVILR